MYYLDQKMSPTHQFYYLFNYNLQKMAVVTEMSKYAICSPQLFVEIKTRRKKKIFRLVARNSHVQILRRKIVLIHAVQLILRIPHL